MSLISLSSADNNHNASQQPFNFKNNFNQPIVIKPNSQVCLVNFYHFRDDELYNITNDNNRIGFNFGDPTTNGRWYAYLRPSIYTGSGLSTELARALNEANIAFQNYTFTSTFTLGNRNANPPINDVFTITFASLTLPDTIGGSWTNFESVGNNTITVDNTADEYTSIQTVIDNNEDRHISFFENGILNHEGFVEARGFSKFGGLNSAGGGDGIKADDTKYLKTFKGQSLDLYPLSRINVNSNDERVKFSPDRPLVRVSFESARIVIKVLDSRTNLLQSKRTISSAGLIAIETVLFTNADRKKDVMYGCKIIKDGPFEFAVQLSVSLDGGLNWTIPVEGNDTGATYGVNPNDDCPFFLASKTINGIAYNGLIYRSGQDRMPLAAGGNTNALSATNRLTKVRGKFVPFVQGRRSLFPIKLDADFTTFELETVTTRVNYGGGGSNYGIEIIEHTEDNGFSYNMVAGDQQGTPVANQSIPANWDNTALKENLTKNAMGLVFDIHADKDDPVSAVIGEFHFDRRSTNNNQFGNFSLRSLDGATFENSPDVFGITVPVAVPATASRNMIVEVQGVYNPENRVVKHQHNQLAKSEHSKDNAPLEDGDTVEVVRLGDDLSLTSVILLDRINQLTIDNLTPQVANASPYRLNANTRSGNIGALLGFQEVVEDLVTGTTGTFTSDTVTKVVVKDTTLHISIPELSGVKSFEGESSQKYKTIKVIPKSDFSVDNQNGSLSYTANYEDYIDINNAQELQLSELTIQVRQPDGILATNLKPDTRCTIKIQPKQDANMQKMEKLLDIMERSMSQNQKYIPDTSNPALTYT
jgi:hypothetical protein